MAIRRKPIGKRTGQRARRLRVRRISRKRGVMTNSQLTRAVKRLPPPETKTVRYSYINTGGFGLPDFNGTTWGLDNGIYQLHPNQNRIQISLGVQQNQRVGNRVRMKSSYISGIFYTQQQNATYNPTPKPVEVLCMIYRKIGGGNTIDTTMSGFFQNGGGTTTPTGSLIDLTLPVNKDAYKVYYRRVFKIGPADNTGTGSSIGLQYFANNDYKRNQRFFIPLTKYLDKNIRFNDSNNNCQNDVVYMAMIPLMADGTINTAGNALLPVSCIMNQVYNYTDV